MGGRNPVAQAWSPRLAIRARRKSRRLRRSTRPIPPGCHPRRRWPLPVKLAHMHRSRRTRLGECRACACPHRCSRLGILRRSCGPLRPRMVEQSHKSCVPVCHFRPKRGQTPPPKPAKRSSNVSGLAGSTTAPRAGRAISRTKKPTTQTTSGTSLTSR